MMIKQGYFTYDPVSQLLSGDPDQMKGFQVGNLVDWGSIPASTAYSEWVYLGEPSYLPPGMDFNNSLAEKIRGYLAGSLDLDRINREVKEQNPDADTMSEEQYRAASEAYGQYARDIQDLTDEIKDWEDNTADCKTFKEDTTKVLEDVLEFVDNSGLSFAQGIEDQGNHTNDNVDNAYFEDKYAGVDKIDVAGIRSYLKQINGSSPNLFTRLGEVPNHNEHCSCGDCGSDEICGDCPEDGVDYEWDQDCEEGLCFGEEDVVIGTYCRHCDCLCEIRDGHGKLGGESGDVYKTLEGVRKELEPQIEYMTTLSNRYKDQADNIRKLKDTVSDINGLQAVGSGYDVRSRVIYDRIQYSRCLPLRKGFLPDWFGSSEGECYAKPIWRDVNQGVCGDVCTSGGLYGAQIAAASCAAILVTATTGCAGGAPCEALVKESAKWFPVIFDVRVEYTIDETLVDDKDRVMLHNLYAGNSDLYGENLSEKIFTHVAPVFVIYKNHKVKTGDVYVIVYVHIDLEDSEAPKKILKAMNNCNGNQCS
jgi:hypothetical protein